MNNKAPYRAVYCLIWNDDKFPFASDDCQLVFFHLLTTPLSNAFGFYKATLEALAAEKRWSLERYAKGFAECLTNGFVKYDQRSQIIYLPNYLEHNEPANPNVVKGWGNWFSQLPPCDFQVEFYHQLKTICERLGKGFPKAFAESFTKRFAKPFRIQEQKQEHIPDNPPYPPSSQNSPELPKPPTELKPVVFPKEIIIPSILDNDDFKPTWEKWVVFRKSKGGKIKNWTALFNEQLSWLAGFGCAIAIEMLSSSLRNGYTGIFPLDDRGNGKTARGRTAESSDDIARRIMAKRKETEHDQ